MMEPLLEESTESSKKCVPPVAARKSMVSLTSGTQNTSTPELRRATTFMGLLASRRFLKKLQSRVVAKRQQDPQSVLEPTYRMEPAKKVDAAIIHDVMKSVVDKRLSNVKSYSPRQCMILSRTIVDDIQTKLKQMNLSRYRHLRMQLGEAKKEFKLTVSQPTIRASSSTGQRTMENTARVEQAGKLPIIRTPESKHSARSSSSPRRVDTLSARSNASLKRQSSTIFGIMTTRRLAKNFISRFRGDTQSTLPAVIQPTFQLEPIKKFNSAQVRLMLKDIVDARMRTFHYSPKTAAMLTRILTAECKDGVKKMDFPRYKFVCHVTIGENKDHNYSYSSMCVWNTNCDSVAAYDWKNNKCFCNVQVYGIYHD